MSYWDIALMAEDEDLRKREAAAYAQEPHPSMDPIEWAKAKGYLLAGSPGWDAAWASALAGGNTAPGRDPGVITDGQILAAVQAQLPQPMPTPDPMQNLPTPELK